jgi:hypothetical protein
MTNPNDSNIITLFDAYLDEGEKLGDAVAAIINDDQLNEEEAVEVFEDILLPQIIGAFAAKVGAFPDDDNLPNYFSAFCQFEHLTDWENILAATINEAAKDWDGEDYDDDDESVSDDDNQNDFVISQGEWETLSSSERIAKVAAWLRAVARSGENFGGAVPFIKQGPDPYGNDFSKGVKVFDRSKNNFGHGPENQDTPEGNSYLQTDEPEIDEAKDREYLKLNPAQRAKYARRKRFEKRKTGHGTTQEETIDESSRKDYVATANIIRSIENPQKRQMHADLNAKLFSKQNQRFDHARFHAAANTKYKPGSKRSLKESSLPSTAITEQLHNPQSDKIQGYVDFMDRNFRYSKNVTASESPAVALQEAGKLRAEQEKREAQSGDAPYDPTDYFFQRPTKPGRRN